jgi:hypothetical protein
MLSAAIDLAASAKENYSNPQEAAQDSAKVSSFLLTSRVPKIPRALL